MVLITNFAQEICYQLLRNSITFYNSLIIKVFWPMHFFRLNILQSLFCCNICFIQSDYPIFFFKSLVENNSQNWKFAFLSKPTLQNFEPSNYCTQLWPPMKNNPQVSCIFYQNSEISPRCRKLTLKVRILQFQQFLCKFM